MAAISSPETPIGCLTERRMLHAADRLRRTEASVARIAEETGYASESAFAAAFERTPGHPPRHHARCREEPA